MSTSRGCQCTEWINYQEGNTKPLATNYGGIFGAGGAYICSTIIEVVNILQAFTNNDSVFAVYMVPESFINNTEQGMRFNQPAPVIQTKTINKPSTLNSYTPRNNKLLTFPFCFLNVSNNNGSSNTFQYELFKDTDCNFKLKGVPTIGGSIKCVPVNYKIENTDGTEEEGLMAGKFPTLSWSADEFTNWLTQNAVNIGLGVASNLLTIIGGIASGNPVIGVAGITSGGMGIANTMGQVYEHSLTPNSARGNTNAGDINTCTNTNTFYFYKMSIKQEYARIIDNFFSLYGYKVNDLKVPNVNGRTNWNYVKTIDCNITGEIPQEDLQELKNMFDNGVTFWHNPATFLDYSQNNAIV